MNMTALALIAGSSIAGGLLTYSIVEFRAVTAWRHANRWKADWTKAIMERDAAQRAVGRAKAEHVATIQAHKAKEDRIHQQRVEASRKAAVINHERAEERRKVRMRKTGDTLAVTQFRPREEVVVGARESRRSRSSAAGAAA